ncbi:MAG: glycine cleavage system aminomethyltransferase GcvT [Polyangia bacterium]
MSHDLRRTPLHEEHIRRGGKMVEFAGYEMPVSFAGIKAEHNCVRQAAGLFDVSHMGEIWLEGPQALQYAHWLVTNDVASLEDGQVLYSPMCLPRGGIVDDLLVYRLGERKVLLVVNAANHDKDLEHVRSNAEGWNTEVIDRSYETAQLALQGPRAVEIMEPLSGGEYVDLPPFRFAEGEVAGRPCLVSRTGYTGEDGYELYCDNEHAAPVFRALMEAGEKHGLQPVGLGARDTLRLEAKLCLYGNDIDETTTPLEAGLKWTVKLEAGDFNGRDALVKQKEEGIPRKLAGFRMIDRGIARHGYPIVPADAEPDAEPISHVASGAPSPTLNENIGLAYLPRKGYKSGKQIGIVVRAGTPRARTLRAEIVKTPFYKRAQ